MFLKDWTITNLTPHKITLADGKFMFFCTGTLTEHMKIDYVGDFGVLLNIDVDKDVLIHEKIRDMVTPYATTAQIKSMSECLKDEEVSRLDRFKKMYEEDNPRNVNRYYLRCMSKEIAGIALRDMREVIKNYTNSKNNAVAETSPESNDNLREDE